MNGKRYRLVVEAVQDDETPESMMRVAITVDPVAIFSSLDEADKGRLLFRLLAALLHDKSDFLELHREEYTETIRRAVNVIRSIYHGRWTDYTCGLCADDAEMLGWDVTYLRKKEQREKETR